MSVYFTCDWCGEPIEDSNWAKLSIGGPRTREADRHYHRNHRYTNECFNRALAVLDGEELEAPDAGFEWRLVPVGERYGEQCAQVIGTTPLAILDGLDPKLYATLIRAGIRTVEHLADLRDRGESVRGVGDKTSMRLDLLLKGRLG